MRMRAGGRPEPHVGEIETSIALASKVAMILLPKGSLLRQGGTVALIQKHVMKRHRAFPQKGKQTKPLVPSRQRVANVQIMEEWAQRARRDDRCIHTISSL